MYSQAAEFWQRQSGESADEAKRLKRMRDYMLIGPDEEETLEEAMRPLTTRIRPGGLTLFAGAGVSFGEPTNLPLAVELSGTVLRALCVQTSLPDGAHDTLEDRCRTVRPEILFALIYRVIGAAVLDPICALAPAVPNQNHELIAEMARQGSLRAIVTTNFDCCIEKALAETGVDFSVCATDGEFSSVNLDGGAIPVLKLHGDAGRGGRGLQVLMQDVAVALSSPKADVLRRLLVETDFLVVGYSGLDQFDISPVLGGTPSERAIIWVTHSAKYPPHLSGRFTEHRDHVDRLLNRRTLIRMRGDTSRILYKAALIGDLSSSFFSLKRRENVTPWPERVTVWADQFKETAVPLLTAAVVQAYCPRNCDVAYTCAESAMGYAAESTNGRHQILSLLYQGSFGGQIQHDRAQVEKRLERAALVAEDYNCVDLRCDALIELGIVLRSAGNYLRAEQVYSAALEVARAADLRGQQGIILHNLGMLHQSRDPERALSFFRTAAERRRRWGYVVELWTTYEAMAHVFLEGLGNPRLALGACTDAIESCSSTHGFASANDELLELWCQIAIHSEAYSIADEMLDRLEVAGVHLALLGTLKHFLEIRLGLFYTAGEHRLNHADTLWIRWALETVATAGLRNAPSSRRSSEQEIAKTTRDQARPLVPVALRTFEVLLRAGIVTDAWIADWIRSRNSVLRYLSAIWLPQGCTAGGNLFQMIRVLLCDDDLAVLGAAAGSAEQLLRSHREEVFGLLDDLVQHTRFRVREAVASCCEEAAKVRDPRALRLLTMLSFDPHEGVRASAIRQLATLGR